jgi:hypothetical protein
MRLWKISLTVEVKADNKDAAIHEAMRLDDSVVVSSAIDLTARDAARAALLQELYDALSLPFDQALPIVKIFISADVNLVWDKRVTAWCVRHADQIQAMTAQVKKESKR